MADIDLTQEEADALIAMPKNRTNEDIVYFPGRGRLVTIPLTSDDKRENFLLDLRRGRIDLLKATYRKQNGNYILTDDGYILDELELSGC